MTGAADSTAVAVPQRACYRRREPERTLLHMTVRDHLKTFLAEVEASGLRTWVPA